MKKIFSLFILLLTLILLNACNFKNLTSTYENDIIQNKTKVEFSTSSIEPLETTPVITTKNKPIYKEINKNIDEYFRWFYSNNINFDLESIYSNTIKNSTSNLITGHFDRDALAMLEVTSYGEMTSSSITYYIVNENLVYLISKLKWNLNPSYPKEEYEEYFIIDGNIWKYSEVLDELIESSDLEKNEIYELAKNEILGDRFLYNPNDTNFISSKNNQFSDFNKLKNKYFRNFYIKNGEYNSKLFEINFVDYTSEKENGFFVFDDIYLKRIVMWHSDKTTFTQYDYYQINDSYIYVIIFDQEFDDSDHYIYMDDIIKSHYEEYFIVDDIVMIYDTEKQDLVESPENQDILTYYNTAIEKIED